MTYTPERERKLQDLGSQLVQREVYHCASSLMYAISQIMWNCEGFKDAFGDDPNDMMKFYQQDNWEEPGSTFIREDADLEQLEEIAENFGYWSDVLAESAVPSVTDDIEGEVWSVMIGDNMKTFDDGDDAEEAAIESVMPTIRKKVEALVDDWAWVGSEYNLDPEVREVYEHWIISDFLARKLAERGEVTGDFAGLTIWGRCTTGQAISMDGVIQSLAAELWPEELKGLEETK